MSSRVDHQREGVRRTRGVCKDYRGGWYRTGCVPKVDSSPPSKAFVGGWGALIGAVVDVKHRCFPIGESVCRGEQGSGGEGRGGGALSVLMRGVYCD